MVKLRLQKFTLVPAPRRLLMSIFLMSLVTGACSNSNFQGKNDRTQEFQPLPPTPESAKPPTPDLPGGSPKLGDAPQPEESAQFKSAGEKGETHEFKQLDYPSLTVERIQGKKGTVVSGIFEQGTYGPLDVLVVVDTSFSMEDEQENLAPKLGSLLSQLGRADWRVAVTSTDPQDPCMMGVVSKGDPNAAATFNQLVLGMGTNGTNIERPFLRAVQAMACPGQPGWMRQGSKLAILIVSDEDNCHKDGNTGYQCPTEDKYPSYLLAGIAKQRALGTDARVYGIISQPQSPCSTALKTGNFIAEAVSQSGGITGNICAQDYSGVLAEISNHVAQILQVDLALDQAPSAGTLAVDVNGTPWSGYQLEGQRIKFTEAPPFGSSVQVRYRYGVEGVFTDTLTLDKPPLDNTLAVVMENEVLSGDRYEFDPQAKMITLKEVPPEGAVVRATYQANVALNDLFYVGSGPMITESLKVTVDGQPQDGSVFNPQTGEVKISPTPRAQAKVVVTFKRP